MKRRYVPSLRTLAALLTLSAVATAWLTPAPAQASEWMIDLSGLNLQMSDDSTAGLDEDGMLFGVDLRAGVEVAPSVFVELGWFGGSDFGFVRQDHEVDYQTDLFSAGLRARWPLLTWLEPWARIAGGALRQQTTVRGGVDYEGESWGAQGAGSVGFDLLIPRDALQRRMRAQTDDFSFGLSFELGYLMTSAVSGTLEPTSEREDGVVVPALEAGDFRLSGLFWRVGLAARF